MHKRIIYFVTIILVLTGVYFLGVTKGYYQRINVQNFGLVFQQELNDYEDTVPNFGLYKTVIELMRDKYYGDVNFLDVLYGSVGGAVQALNDPYTLFTTPEENEEFFSSLGGTYEGIGVEIDFTYGRLIVVAPLEGSPADLAGIRSGDEIVAIDGRLVIDLDTYTATNLIKGKRGTQIILSILRDGEEVKNISIIRDIVRINSVKLDIQDSIGILRITKFGSDTDKLFNNAVNKVIKEGLKGLILDLRNNPGGFLDVSVEVANEFLDGGLIVEERFKDGKIIPFSADGDGRLSQIPVIVLINEGSASAAEIVAGALRDNNRAILIGQPTYGKGSVQEVEEFGDGSALRITVAHWFMPSGKPISENGIRPDILVKDEEESLEDVQLIRAIKELNKLIGVVNDESNT